jgi:2-keto-4-pentenoate hydratase/2-oxohepta-3-ene-1,7-dioic acid hydratase in catechol pathway
LQLSKHRLGYPNKAKRNGETFTVENRELQMKYIRYRYQDRISYAVLDGNRAVQIQGGLFGERRETAFSAELASLELLCPCEPTKILALGWNYGSHLENRPAPSNPVIFYKPTSALLEPGGAILIPQDSRSLHYEGELAIVIGKNCRGVAPAEAESCIFGFTCGIDVSERYWQKNDLQWWRAKGCDTFAPLGPILAAGFNWREGRIETRLNGSVVQSGRFSELLFDPPSIVSYTSRYLTLYPGDVIYTGTPGHTDNLHPGDRIEVEIPDIGILRNTVVAAE